MMTKIYPEKTFTRRNECPPNDDENLSEEDCSQDEMSAEEDPPNDDENLSEEDCSPDEMSAEEDPPNDDENLSGEDCSPDRNECRRRST